MWCNKLKETEHEWKLMLISFYVGPGGLRAPCVLPCAMRSLAIVITNFRSFSLFYLLFLFRLLLLTNFGETPVSEIILPQYFGITRRYMQQKKLGGGKFYFFTKKNKQIFRPFSCFLRPAFGHGRLGHPQSLEYF